MIDPIKIHNALLKGHIEIDDLKVYKEDLSDNYEKFMTKSVNIKALEALLYLLNDYYTYSTEGDQLIDDIKYHELQRWHETLTGNKIVYPDSFDNKNPGIAEWKVAKHKCPGAVGTIARKIFDTNELKTYLQDLGRARYIIYAPKFDGISVVIEVRHSKIVQALTRYTGENGRDITECVKLAKTTDVATLKRDGFHKCELVVSSNDFEKLKEEKAYSNRRSAASGICSAPKNIHLGIYLTILPLAHYDDASNQLFYNPPDSIRGEYSSDVYEMVNRVEEMLKRIKNVSYQYRADGVVIYPVYSDVPPNHYDFMELCCAWKDNSAWNITTIRDVVMSVGRAGKAVPVAKVAPVEVNETIVEDVSLGSYGKFDSLNLYYDQDVVVYSAGDVIPQIRLPEFPRIPRNATKIKLIKKCPYCNEELSKEGMEFFCRNSDCVQVIAGRITNFLDKLDVKNVSDKTVKLLYAHDVVTSILDLFELTFDKLIAIPGIQHTMANNILTEIRNIQTRPIEISTLLGALGIEGVAKKTCKKIMQYVPYKDLVDMKRRQIGGTVLGIPGIGPKTAETFSNFFKEHKTEIRYIVGQMNIISDMIPERFVCFSGFRDDDLKRIFNDAGWEVEETVSSHTDLLVVSSYGGKSVKMRLAEKYNIPIVRVADLDLNTIKDN